MKILLIACIAAFAAATCLHAEPEKDDVLANLPEPPPDAVAGTGHDGIQIGLWSQKETYSGKEIRNVWMFARKKDDSPLSIDGSGDLFKESFLYVTKDGQEVAKIREGGPIDTLVGSAYFAGGISAHLASLPFGSYVIVWRTPKFESNQLRLNIE